MSNYRMGSAPVIGSVNVYNYGVDPTGARDSSAGIADAVADAIRVGLPLFFPGGAYRWSATIPITSSLRIKGAGRGVTFLRPTGVGQVAFAINADTAISFEHMCFQSVAAGQTAISVTAPDENALSSFSDLQLVGFGTGIDFQRAAYWNMRNCFFQTGNRGQYGIRVANTAHVDFGDSSISDSFFISNNPGSVGIRQESSGGLKTSNTKFIGVGGWGYQLALAPGVATSDLLFGNCSFEGFTGAGSGAIGLGRQSNTGTFGNVVISGVQFAGNAVNIAQLDTTPGWLTNVRIGTCVLASPGISSISLPAVSGADGLVIDGIKQ